MDILNKIDEKTKKPSFEEFFLNSKNKKMVKKEWLKNYSQFASELGEDMLEDPQYYDGNGIDYEEDPVDAYENFAHSTGYQAEYDASSETILHFKNKYKYEKNDENDEEKQYNLAEFMGYEPSF